MEQLTVQPQPRAPGLGPTTHEVYATAAQGIADQGGPPPHFDEIQRLFGHHDLSGVAAHVGGAAETASRALGAEGYAAGNHVAFASAPDLHTAAHEAAHVVQQRGGVQLKGGVGESGDAHEKHADEVADAVVQGRSAERLLDRYAGGSAGGAVGVQRQEATSGAAPAPAAPAATGEAPAEPAPAPIVEQKVTSAADAPAAPPDTRLAPDDVAELILRRPDNRDDILQWADRAGGAAYVHQVLAAVDKHPRAASTTPPGAASSSTMALPALVRVTSPEGLRVRRTASKESDDNVAGVLHHDAVVTALAREADWLRIEYQGAPAYVFAAFVEPARTAASSTATPAVADQGQASHDAPPKATPTPPVHSDASQAPRAESQATTPATAATGKNYLEKYTSLGGTNIASLKTTKHEADILNAVRHSDHRFAPAWLAKAQVQLGVAPTGAFNTETLRALTARHAKLDAESILTNRDGQLTQLAPGAPFVATTDGFGTEKREATGATKADRAAHTLGYADYQALFGTFQPASFLGVLLDKGQGKGLAHPHLLERLRIAEAFLRQRHPEAKSDKEIIHAIGWNKFGNASYHEDVKFGTSHFHTMGLAIDIDVAHNPYIFTGTSKVTKNDSDAVKKQKQEKNWWQVLFEKHLGYAAKIFGGEKISAAALDSWAGSVSTDELYARVTEVSQSFAKYLAIANDPDDKLLNLFMAAGISAEVARTDLRDVHQMPHYLQLKGGSEAKPLTNHSQELLVALRDVAGLAWGGAEMSSNENGDFMHFDCRQDSLGRVLQRFNFP